MHRSLGPKAMLFPTPLVLVGAYKEDGTANIMAAAWVGVACSKPPMVAVSMRGATHTHGLIMSKNAFTISIPGTAMAEAADYAGMVSGKGRDKFADTGLTPVASQAVDAPYPAEAPLVIECRLHQAHELGLHTQFLGEVVDVKVREDCLNADGLPDPAKVDPFVYLPELKKYFALGREVGKAFDLGRRFMDRKPRP